MGSKTLDDLQTGFGPYFLGILAPRTKKEMLKIYAAWHRLQFMKVVRIILSQLN